MRDSETALHQLATIARISGRLEIAELAEERLRRSRAGETYIACVGQFKRGKSTLLNRLIGRPILPVGALPATNIPTVVRHGPARLVLYLDGRTEEHPLDRLGQFTTEAGNPGNAAGVRWAEAFVESELLAQGLCIVDTPGLGSIEEAHDLRVRASLPRIDVLLLVIGVDPPITAAELGLLNDPEAPKSTILVIGKSDRHSPEERAAIRDYVRQVLDVRLRRHGVEQFEVSATRPAEEWPELARLRDALSLLAREGGSAMRHRATERELERLAQLLAADLRWEMGMLDRPNEEARTRAADCQRLAARAARWPRELRALLRMVESGWWDWLEAHVPLEVDRLRALTLPPGDADPVAAARMRVDEWREVVERKGAAVAGELWRTVDVEMNREIVGAVGLRELIGLPPAEFPPCRFVFHERLNAASAGPFGWFTAWLWGSGPRAMRRRYVDLIEVNCWRAAGDVRDRVTLVREELQGRADKTVQAIQALADRLAELASERAAGRGATDDGRRAALAGWERAVLELLAMREA